MENEITGQSAHSMCDIMLVVSTLRCGGSEHSAVVMANYWSAQGKRVIVCVGNGADCTLLPELSANVSTFVLVVHSNQVARSVMPPLRAQTLGLCRLWSLIRKFCPTVIVAFPDLAYMGALMGAIGSGIPVIASERSIPGGFPLGFLMSALRRILLKRAANIVAVSWEVQKRLIKEGFSRVVVIPGPVSILMDEPIRRQEIVNIPVILSVGRLSPEKGIDRLIYAFHSIANRFPNSQLHIYGEGPEQEALQTLTLELKRGDRIRFMGFTSTPHEVMGGAQIFVLPSQFEGYSRALAEAMILGLAVVAFNCPGGVGEMIIDGENGYLVPEGDIDGLAARIASLLENGAERARIGENARRIVEVCGVSASMARWDALMASFFEVPAHDARV